MPRTGATVAGGVTSAASGRDLLFDPEINDAFELGLKYDGPGIDVNLAVFRQDFKDFQLNTFNGINFEVENINSCSELNVDNGDTDVSATTGACSARCVRACGRSASRSRCSRGRSAMPTSTSASPMRTRAIGTIWLVRPASLCRPHYSSCPTGNFKRVRAGHDGVVHLDSADRVGRHARPVLHRRSSDERVQHGLGP